MKKQKEPVKIQSPANQNVSRGTDEVHRRIMEEMRARAGLGGGPRRR